MKKVSVEEWIPVNDIVLEDNADFAVKCKENILVVAGPGAGKTELLAQKAGYLFQTDICRDPQKILAISFKTDAAENLKQRVCKRYGNEVKSRFSSMTYDAFSKRLDSFLDERSEELIENWSLVTTDDLSTLEERCTSACDSIDALEKRFSEFTNATDAKIEDLDKRLKALEDAEKDLEEAEEVAVEAGKE